MINKLNKKNIFSIKKLLLIFLIIAVIFPETKVRAENKKIDSILLGYIFCVQAYIVTGSFVFFEEHGRTPHPDDLISVSMEACEKNKIKSINELQLYYKMEMNNENFKTIEHILEEKLLPELKNIANTTLEEINSKQ
jgi:hypothetical protein